MSQITHKKTDKLLKLPIKKALENIISDYFCEVDEISINELAKLITRYIKQREQSKNDS